MLIHARPQHHGQEPQTGKHQLRRTLSLPRRCCWTLCDGRRALTRRRYCGHRCRRRGRPWLRLLMLLIGLDKKKFWISSNCGFESFIQTVKHVAPVLHSYVFNRQEAGYTQLRSAARCYAYFKRVFFPDGIQLYGSRNRPATLLSGGQGPIHLKAESHPKAVKILACASPFSTGPQLGYSCACLSYE